MYLTRSLLVEERTGTSSAGTVYDEIGNLGCCVWRLSSDHDKFRVLTAYLEDSICFRIKACCPGGLGNNLIYEGYCKKVSDKFPTCASGSGELEPVG